MIGTGTMGMKWTVNKDFFEGKLRDITFVLIIL